MVAPEALSYIPSDWLSPRYYTAAVTYRSLNFFGESTSLLESRHQKQRWSFSNALALSRKPPKTPNLTPFFARPRSSIMHPKIGFGMQDALLLSFL